MGPHRSLSPRATSPAGHTARAHLICRLTVPQSSARRKDGRSQQRRDETLLAACVDHDRTGDGPLEVDGPDPVRPAERDDRHRELGEAPADCAAVTDAEDVGDVGGGQEAGHDAPPEGLAKLPGPLGVWQFGKG